MAMDLQTISDKLEINELLSRYARGVDTKDWDLWRSVFTADAVLDYSAVGVPVGSPETIGGFFEKALAKAVSQHLVSNVEIELDGDRATVRAMFYNPMQFPGMPEMTFYGGYYHHKVVRTAEGWKSEHLVEEIAWSVNKPGG